MEHGHTLHANFYFFSFLEIKIHALAAGVNDWNVAPANRVSLHLQSSSSRARVETIRRFKTSHLSLHVRTRTRKEAARGRNREKWNGICIRRMLSISRIFPLDITLFLFIFSLWTRGGKKERESTRIFSSPNRMSRRSSPLCAFYICIFYVRCVSICCWSRCFLWCFSRSVHPWIASGASKDSLGTIISGSTLNFTGREDRLF